MYLNNIIIESTDENEEVLAEILEGLHFLCGTAEGTFPMNREFGINADIIDQPLPVVKQLLPIELKEKIERFEPRVEVSDISFDYDEDSMNLIPKIQIELKDDWNKVEEDDEYDDLEEDEDDN